MNVHSLGLGKDVRDEPCPSAALSRRGAGASRSPEDPPPLLTLRRRRVSALQRVSETVAEPLRSQNQDETLVRLRRQQIFAAACRVLRHKSFHEATVKEIALEAGLAAGSIYLYLQSKDDILLLLAESMVAELAEMLPRIRGQSRGEPRRELLELMRAAIEVIDRYREAFCVLNQEVRYLARRPDYRVALKQIVGRYTSTVENVLERGRRMGVIFYDDLRSVVQAIHMLCSGWAMGADYLGKTDKETYWRQIAALVEGRCFNPAQRSAEI